MALPKRHERVKERTDPAPCRYCGRPTWSWRRHCVPCKWSGAIGSVQFPSIDIDPLARPHRLATIMGAVSVAATIVLPVDWDHKTAVVLSIGLSAVVTYVATSIIVHR